MDTPIIPPKKTCTKCGVEYPATAEYFGMDRGRVRCDCKVCRKVYNTQYREKNKESLKKKRQTPEFRERLRNRLRRYREERPEYFAEYDRKYREENAEKIKAKQQEYRDKNRKLVSLRSTNWRKNHREQHNSIARNRRARKLASLEQHTKEDIDQQYHSQKGRCWWCGKLIKDTYHVDHRIPLSKGGSNGARNLVISCPNCNQSKHNKLPHEWNGRLL